MQTVQIESLCVYPSVRDFMAVGFIWAGRRCHILDSRIVRDFRVDLVLAVEGAVRTEESGGYVDAIVGVSGDSILGLVIGSVISSLESELSLFLLLPFSVVDDRIAVAGTMIYVLVHSRRLTFRKRTVHSRSPYPTSVNGLVHSRSQSKFQILSSARMYVHALASTYTLLCWLYPAGFN